MADVGRPTELTKELLSEIKRHITSGKTLKETANLCDIPISTLYGWHSDNYLTLADKVEGWKRDCKLFKADRNITKILDLKIDDKDFTKTVADMSKFVKETLDKENYSKRTEATGKDGKDLQVTVINYGKDNNPA